MSETGYRWAKGDYNAVCYECGRKFKASELRRHWQGYFVCPEHWEPRQPQDFVRGIQDVQTVPWAQPMEDEFIPQVFYVQLNDGIAAVETLGKDYNTALSETAIATDSLKAAKTVKLNDGAAAADSLTLAHGYEYRLNDSASVADSLSFKHGYGINLSDTLLTSESFQVPTLLDLYDQLMHEEAFTHFTTHLLSLSDSVEVSETRTSQYFMKLESDPEIADYDIYLQTSHVHSLSDTLTASDSIFLSFSAASPSVNGSAVNSTSVN